MKKILSFFLFPLLVSASLQSPGPFKPKDFSNLLGMPGFDDGPLKTHFELYHGAVARTNLLLSTLKAMRHRNEQKTPCYTDIKRQLMFFYDAMRLHEYYFSNLGGHGTIIDRNSPLYKEIVAQYGSFDDWLTDFRDTGETLGIGWAILVRDPLSGLLVNEWINEYDQGHLAGGDPILVLDVWEHAYLCQWGLDRDAYIDVFMQNVDWRVVERRYEDELHCKPVSTLSWLDAEI